MGNCQIASCAVLACCLTESLLLIEVTPLLLGFLAVRKYWHTSSYLIASRWLTADGCLAHDQCLLHQP